MVEHRKIYIERYVIPVIIHQYTNCWHEYHVTPFNKVHMIYFWPIFFSEGGTRGGYNNYNRGGGYTMNGGPPQSYSQPSKTF